MESAEKERRKRRRGMEGCETGKGVEGEKKMRVMKGSTREERIKIRKREEENNAGGRKEDEESTGDEWIKRRVDIINERKGENERVRKGDRMEEGRRRAVMKERRQVARMKGRG